MKGRLARYGRSPDELDLLPAATFVLADTDTEAQELAAVVRAQQVSGQTAIKFLEQLWNRDLSAYDPDGPLPEIDPLVGETRSPRAGRASGCTGIRSRRRQKWRELAAAKQLSDPRADDRGHRPPVVRRLARHGRRGDRNAFVAGDASDGFILVPHITPGGLDEFADKVVPLLQERGVFRSEYEGTTLRDHLGLRRHARETAHPIAARPS